MTILVAPNAFKGALSAADAAAAIGRGIAAVRPDAEVRFLPVADGGDGLLDVASGVLQAEIRSVRVADPLGRLIQARFGLNTETRCAVIEMAEASGLALLDPDERDPMRATTLGTGQLIFEAAKAGARRILLGIGGSATTDGGMGMAAALGIRFLDASGQALDPCGGSLGEIVLIDPTDLEPHVRGITFDVVCDVDNPLLGPNGAAHVFAPQKGASAEQVRALEAGLTHYASLLKRDLGVDVNQLPGSGAAGGLGAGLVAFLDARLRPGAEAVLDVVDCDAALKGADWVVTGEGRLDASSRHGKAPVAVATRAAREGIPCLALVGSVESGAWPEFQAVVPISPGSSKAHLKRTAQLLEAAARAWAEGL